MLERPAWTESFDALIAQWQSLSPERQSELRCESEARFRAEIDTKSEQAFMDFAKRFSDLGAEHRDCTFASYRVPPGDANALRVLEESLDDLHRGAWLFGPFGNGKTHLGAAAINALIGQRIPATITSALGLLDRIKATYDRGGNVRDGQGDILSGLIRVPYLLLDDLDKIVLTEWSAQRLYVLVNGRYEAKRGIAITTNISPADLKNQWVARLQKQADSDLLRALIGSIFDRLLAMTRIIAVRGESQRGQKA